MAETSDPKARIHLAIDRYETEGLSLAKAADLAGVSWAQMREILLEKGVPPRLGPETLEEAEKECAWLRPEAVPGGVELRGVGRGEGLVDRLLQSRREDREREG